MKCLLKPRQELADYSILVRSGFTKKQAMQSQFLTAVGAFVSSPLHQHLHLLIIHSHLHFCGSGSVYSLGVCFL